LTAAPSSAAGSSAVTVTAITLSTEPHRHLRATRPHDQRALTQAVCGVPGHPRTAPANGCACLGSPWYR
jgi:hypothetical protein